MIHVDVKGADLCDAVGRYKVMLDYAAKVAVKRVSKEIRDDTIEAYSRAAGYVDTRRGDIPGEFDVALDNTSLAMEHTITVSGKDATFMEFGAGIHFNGTGAGNHPKAGDMGITMGMYGSGNGNKDKWGIPSDKETKERRWSYGTPETAGFYNAFTEHSDIGNVEKIFKEVLE